jgi:UDP-3-O-[3-hydroxymyristoyl] glucosamine N-acyltransferase
VRVKDLAAFLEAPFEGDGERVLRRVTALEDAGPDDLSFVTSARTFKRAQASAAGCLLVPADFENAAQRTVVRTPQPRAAAARAIPKLHPKIEPPPGVHPSAVIGPGAILEPGTHIAPLVSIGAGVRVGAGSSIGAGSVIGDYVVIGEKCTVHPNVTIYSDVTLGS